MKANGFRPSRAESRKWAAQHFVLHGKITFTSEIRGKSAKRRNHGRPLGQKPGPARPGHAFHVSSSSSPSSSSIQASGSTSLRCNENTCTALSWGCMTKPGTAPTSSSYRVCLIGTTPTVHGYSQLPGPRSTLVLPSVYRHRWLSAKPFSGKPLATVIVYVLRNQ